MKRTLSFLILVFIVIIALSGCSTYSRPAEERNTGFEISVDDLLEIRKQLYPEESEVPTTHIITPATDVPESEETTLSQVSDSSMPTETSDSTVYWTENGEVWHTRTSCSSLKRSKNLTSGSIEQAILAGKDRVCKRCG